jgi:four helix bundle protein
MFGFQKLDVYRCATEFLSLSAPLADRTPRGYHALADQLRRAALSIPLNIAEGSGKFERDAKRFYAIARGSALECAAIIDAIEMVAKGTVMGREAEVGREQEFERGRELLDRVVAMLTVMVR